MNKWETDNKIKIKFMKKPRLGIIVVAIIALFSCGKTKIRIVYGNNSRCLDPPKDYVGKWIATLHGKLSVCANRCGDEANLITGRVMLKLTMCRVGPVINSPSDTEKVLLYIYQTKIE